MENISISTSQNIAIEQQLASVGERIAAASIDFTIMIGYVFLMSILSGLSGVVHLLGFMSIPLAFYHIVSELTMNGQTWGKRIMKIKVVMLNGSAPGVLPYFLRWVFRLVDIYMLGGSIATVTIILNKKGQRVGDIAAGTTVIRTREKKLTDTLFTKLPDNYKIIYPQAELLAVSDIQTIKEVLSFLKKTNKSTEAMVLADKTKKALESKMKIEAGARSEHFLYHLIRDFNYLHKQPSSPNKRYNTA